ncbi:MAG TPA: hypothetical protein VL128_09590 [Candidatus Eisenbacteria bacterium]|nr:hypothetical protein [Candidatus Eisenbacteria bacterium]
MKKILLGLCCALLLSAFGPVPSASAWWLWHHHHKNPAPAASGSSGTTASAAPAPAPTPAPAPKPRHQHWGFWHHEKHEKAVVQNGVGTTPGPRSVGWWHKSPGPAGAGAE